MYSSDVITQVKPVGTRDQIVLGEKKMSVTL